MNSSVPYENWPLFIGRPDIPLEVRENVFGVALMTAIGSLFAVPGMIAHYIKSRSSLALVSLIYVIATTCVLVSNIFFDFRSKSTSLVAVYHNASELMFLLFAIAQGSLQIWQLIVLGVHITIVSLLIALLPNERGLSFLAFGLAGETVDILVFALWLLVFLENRRNPGSEGQRSGLVLFVAASFLHLLGSSIYGLRSANGEMFETTVQSALFSIFTVFSVHLTVFATRIIERAPYDVKWTSVWWKWIPAAFLSVALVGFTLFLKFK